MLKVFFVFVVCIILFIIIINPKIITQIQTKIQSQSQSQSQTQPQTQTKLSDCSKNVIYGICKNIYGLPINCEGNTSGLEKGSKTVTYKVIPGIKCPEPSIIGCDLKCDIDCVGAWKNVGSCKIDRCDLTNNTVGLGKQTQEFVVSTQSKNQGKPCPGPTREIDCSFENYIECTQCGGENGMRVPGATCDNITTCEDLIGIGERIDKWYATSYNVLPGCITPPDIKVKCNTAGEWPNCNCKYSVQDESFCNETNTVCKGIGSECIVDYTVRESLPQPNNAPGICTDQLRNKFYNVNLDKCRCTVKRELGNWIYTNPRCNRTTFIADKRSRSITIEKTGGNKACTFSKLSNNEKILDTDENNKKGQMYVETLTNTETLQFGAENDLIGSTFQTIETEDNINLPDNINCKCQGTYEDWDVEWSEWTNDRNCPSRTDYNIGDSAFNITQSRTKNRTFKISNSGSLFSNYSCPEAEIINTRKIETKNYTCPRDCFGDWNEWSGCNTACPGNALTNNGTSTKTSSGGQARRTRTYKIDAGKTALGDGNKCSKAIGDSEPQDCNTGVACVVNCTGGNWDNTTPCTAPACNPSSTETQSTKSSSQRRNWVGAIGPFNNGTPCPASVTDTCSRTCPIDCKGEWDANYTGCTAIACNPASTETLRVKKGTAYKYFRKKPNGDPINNGAACPSPDFLTQECYNYCDVDCAGGWGDGNNVLGLGHRRYTRRPDSNVGNCPADGHEEPVNGPAGTGVPKNMSNEKKFIHPRDGWPANGWQIVWWEGKDDGNRLKWYFEADGRIRSLHRQEHNVDLFLRPKSDNPQADTDIIFSKTGNSHRWRRRSGDGKIEYMGSSNYRPSDLCMHTSNSFDNDKLVTLKPCRDATRIDLV